MDDPRRAFRVGFEHLVRIYQLVIREEKIESVRVASKLANLIGAARRSFDEWLEAFEDLKRKNHLIAHTDTQRP
jgi:hypothetical protein